MLMALQVLEIYEFIPSTYLTSKSTKKGYIGAILAGILAGVFASPCATPVLVVLLAFVASKGTLKTVTIPKTVALSKEGKLQVELAQLNYRLPRLYGMGGQMSRTGAGIGTRGPGEQKLEIDKRNILNKAADIRRELREVKKIRETQRVQRLKSSIPIVALVGYTNAGKSTLLNELIKTHKDYDVEKEVMAKDMLFATLDVTLRKALLPNKKEFLVVDTVGFVSNLPHELMNAFSATLEEVRDADLCLIILDASDKNKYEQLKLVEEELEKQQVSKDNCILVYNKCDLLNKMELSVLEDFGYTSCKIQAKHIQGITELKALIREKLNK